MNVTDIITAAAVGLSGWTLYTVTGLKAELAAMAASMNAIKQALDRQLDKCDRKNSSGACQ